MVAAIVSISLAFSLVVPCFAADEPKSVMLDTEVSEAQLISQMEDLGFTSAEIDMILSLEAERIQAERSGISITWGGFPSNPKEGDWYYNTFQIHLSTITLSVSGIAGALIKGGVGAALAMVAASAIMNELMESSGYEILEVTQSFRYGINNDGVLDWNYGPITWRLL